LRVAAGTSLSLLCPPYGDQVWSHREKTKCRSQPTRWRHGPRRAGVTGISARRGAHSKFWRKGYELLPRCPRKPKRNPEQARAAETILRAGRESREAFHARHAEAVYAR
jgi:hypothetical protein